VQRVVVAGIALRAGLFEPSPPAPAEMACFFYP
jgi:hypothetical protein